MVVFFDNFYLFFFQIKTESICHFLDEAESRWMLPSSLTPTSLENAREQSIEAQVRVVLNLSFN